MVDSSPQHPPVVETARWGKRGRRRRRRGQALVEFALILPVLLLLAAGGGDLARAFSEKTGVTNAAREAARVAALPEIGDPTQNSCADHDIWQAAVNEAPALPWPSLPACPGTPAASASTCSLSITPSQATRAEGTDQAISVSVQCPFTAITPFVAQATGSATLTLTQTATARPQY